MHGYWTEMRSNRALYLASPSLGRQKPVRGLLRTGVVGP